MPDSQHSCCFTGHRESKLPWRGNDHDERCLKLKQRIYDAVEAVYADGIRHYICGMANGCDLYFLEAVLRFRADHPDVTVEAAIPYAGQAEHWRGELKETYSQMLSMCDYETVVQQIYSAGCMMRRNRYMVDHSRVLIAAYNGETGGTMNTMLYAMRRGLNVIELPVETE